jgi:predicted Rossmann-fold nucleotide-binding protein
MPAPNRPNTGAATAASVAARQRTAQERKAVELRAADWIVAEPGPAGAAEAIVKAVAVLSKHAYGSDLVALEDARAAIEQFRSE